MKQHPVRTAFELVQDPPSREFRETLRAQLLADLAAPIEADAAFPKDPQTPQPIQEIVVTQTNESSNTTSPRRRALLSIAAAVIVAVGVTAVVINSNNADNTSVPATDPTIDSVPATDPTDAPRSDALIADAALLTEGDLGSPFSLASTSSRIAFTTELGLQAAVPECADQFAAHGDLTEIITSTGSQFRSGQGQSLGQTVLIFPTLEDATRVFDAYAAYGSACGVAFYGSASGVTAVAVDFAPPTQHGDQQTSWGVTIPVEPPHLTHIAWVQVGRAMVRITASNEAEGATDADPFGMLDIALAALVDSIAAELAAG